MVKTVLVSVAIGLVIIIAYGVKNAFGISDLAYWIALLAVTLFVMNWHFSQRLDTLEERVIHKDYSGIIAAIKKGERHVPQHHQPQSLSESRWKSFITSAHEILFEDFRWFGVVLNQHVSEPWSIEELPDTAIRDWLADMPQIGRRYQVYCNACEIGTVQVTVGGYEHIGHPERFAENRQARVLIDLKYLRFVPYDDAHSLISAIMLLIGRFEDGDAASSKASAEATAALTEHLWESVRNPDFDVGFSHRTDGPYEVLRQTVDHWKANGIVPIEKWGGDRSWHDRSEGET